MYPDDTGQNPGKYLLKNTGFPLGDATANDSSSASLHIACMQNIGFMLVACGTTLRRINNRKPFLGTELGKEFYSKGGQMMTFMTPFDVLIPKH